MNDQPKKLGDVLGNYVGGMEASSLLLIGTVNRLCQLMHKAGLANSAWFDATINELIGSIENLEKLRDNPEVKRRLPIMKDMLLEGITDAGDKPHA